MSRLKILCATTILLALVIIGVAWFTNAATATSIKPPAPPPVHHPFQISQTYVAGSPAIHPHMAQNGSGAAFTRDDVVAYFNAHSNFFGPLLPGVHLKILTIQFVTAQQASRLMYGESVGRPDDALVCYVKAQGPFYTTYMHGGPNLPGVKHPATAQEGDAVFDAHTGNLLVWGLYF